MTQLWTSLLAQGTGPDHAPTTDGMLPTDIGYALYFIPLLISISVVYSASRNEDVGKMIGQIIGTAVNVLVFHGLMFAVI
ncbi:MAG: hypothetical protein AAFN70_16915, partial [Planctomycetota bacterium]